jgi:hypothetical protein
MRCQFFRKMPTMRRNLLRLYRKHSNDADKRFGSAWYDDAHRIVLDWADSYQLPIVTVACVVAAISPQCEWKRNLIVADDVLAGRPASVGGPLPVNVRKARQLLADRATDITKYFPHGPKVASFAVNLAGDTSTATIDAHAMQAALNDVKADYRLRWTPYAVFATCYADAAAELGLQPAVFQAIIWHTWKRLHPAAAKRVARRKWEAIGDLED